jgi:hypothetical protein
VIIAHVMWRDGGRAGLLTEDRVPIAEIITFGQPQALQLTRSNGERRSRLRPNERARVVGQGLEFVGVLMIVVCLAAAGLTMLQAAFARPLVTVVAALSR